MNREHLRKIITLIIALILAIVYYKYVGDKGAFINILAFMFIYIAVALLVRAIMKEKE